MILAAILWVFQAGIFALYGRGFIRLVKKLAVRGDETTSSPMLVFLTGLAVVTSLAELLSLFINLGALALGILTMGALILLAREWRLGNLKQVHFAPKNLWAEHKGWLLAGLALVFIVLEISTRLPANPDTAIYHAQAIHWIETYPAVPGLGNLHSRLAYDSSWLVLNALFSLAFTGVQSFHTTPGLLLAAFSLYALGSARRIYEKNARLSDWSKALLLPLTFATVAAESSSPGTDFPALIMLWCLLAEWISTREKSAASPLNSLLIAWLSIFAVTVKLSVAPAALFTLLVLISFMRSRKLRQTGWLIAGCVLAVAPWCARNVVLSGYLVYPMPALDLFQVDWKIPTQNAADETLVIQSWAKIPREDAMVVHNMPLAEWAKTWYFNQSTATQALLGTALGSLFLFFACAALSRRFRGRAWPAVKPHLSAYLVILAGLTFWFLSAPDVRFGYSFILAALVLGFSPWLLMIEPFSRQALRWTAPVILLVILFLWGVSYRPLGLKSVFTHLVTPSPYADYSTNPCQIRGKTLLCAAAYNECGYDAFPCIPTGSGEVEMRGGDTSAGFRAVK